MKHTRTLLALLAAGAVAVGTSTPVANADDTTNYLTVLATTDVHGHVYNWDYFADAAYPAEGKTAALGLSRVCTIAKNQRAEKGADAVVMLDNGDAIQGTPLTYLAAMQPDKLPNKENPMAVAFNAIGYDAQNLGNHEFNYGLDYLNGYIDQLNAPVLGGNILKAGTEEPAYTPYVILEKTIDGKTVKVGVLGVDTPGIRVWDKKNVSGKLDFKDGVEIAQKYVPQMKAEGADVIVVLIHSGLDADGVEWNPAELQENVAKSLATKVNDIDVVIGGHSHVTENHAYTAPDGDPVVFAQPSHWAQSVAEVDVPLTFDENGKAHVAWPANADDLAALTKQLPTKTVAECEEMANNQILKADHAATIDYVNTPVATSVEELSAATSYYEDTPILDYIAMVQSDTVTEALKGTEYENLPVISEVSPFSRTALFPKGEVTIKDIAGLYIYENTLLGVKLTGAQVKDYLEWSARYYVQTEEGAQFDPENGANALYEGETRGIPDYSYDAIQGLDYLIDISKPVGERVLNLSYHDGTPVGDNDEFVLAVNNYRQSGGSGYPHVADAPVLYDEVQEIRQLIIERAQSDGVIDPAEFFEDNWALVTKTPTPTVTTDKQQYTVGDPVQVTLAGFLPNRETKVYLGAADPVTVTTDENGGATLELHAVVAGNATVTAQQSALSANTLVDIVVPEEPGGETPQIPAGEEPMPVPSTTPPPVAATPLAKTGAEVAGFALTMMMLLAGGGVLLRRKLV